MTTSPSTDHAREIRNALADPRFVCERLGLLSDRRKVQRQAGGFIVACPHHGGVSCSVTRGRDGTVRYRCFGCGESGDVLSLVGAVRGLSTRRDFRKVLLEAAEIAGEWAIVYELESGKRDETRSPVAAPPTPDEPPREYPSASDVECLWSQCRPTSDDDEVGSWLVSRGLDAALVDAGDLARALPKDVGSLPHFARYHGRSWVNTGHRLIVPMRDASGEMRSVRAGRVVDGETPKRLPPSGHKASELVMADELGAAMLAGRFQPAEVMIVEGEPDFLTWATQPKPRPCATIGVVSGSWSPSYADRFPIGGKFWIFTDHDPAGERYAREIWAGLRRRGFPRRGRP